MQISAMLKTTAQAFGLVKSGKVKGGTRNNWAAPTSAKYLT